VARFAPEPVLVPGLLPQTKHANDLSCNVRANDTVWKRHQAAQIWALPGETPEAAIFRSPPDHPYDIVEAPELPQDFVIHSIKNTMLMHPGGNWGGDRGKRKGPL
jgi:hypothetical protein